MRKIEKKESYIFLKNVDYLKFIDNHLTFELS